MGSSKNWSFRLGWLTRLLVRLSFRNWLFVCCSNSRTTLLFVVPVGPRRRRRRRRRRRKGRPVACFGRGARGRTRHSYVRAKRRADRGRGRRLHVSPLSSSRPKSIGASNTQEATAQGRLRATTSPALRPSCDLPSGPPRDPPLPRAWWSLSCGKELRRLPQWQGPHGGPALFRQTPHKLRGPIDSSAEGLSGRVRMAASPCGTKM